MPKTVTLTHDYPHPAQDVWAVVTDFEHLKTVTRGLITFKSLPTGTISAGQHLSVEVSLFGLLPYQPYTMQLTAFDPVAHSFCSDENGAGVRIWRHSLSVSETRPGHCRITESIEIDAGRATFLFAAWARFMYKKRHAPRLKILATLHPQEPA